MPKLRAALAASISAALACLAASPAQAAPGDLTQKAGTAACISEDGTGGVCADGEALGLARSITVSPDGTSAYVASVSSDAVAIFDRASDGTLTQKPGTDGCISEDGTGGACTDGRALNYAFSVSVSPDGDSVYVASPQSNGVAIFDRASDGTLTQKPGTAGCISDTGSGGCTDGTALDGAISVTVSPDGDNAYVGSVNSDAVAVFDRAPGGALTQKAGTAGCISETGSAGACADGVALDGPNAVTASPDGASVYVATQSSNSVAILDRSPGGTLTQKAGTAGCISEGGTGGACADGVALTDARWVTVSPDGTSAYAASYGSGAVTIFDRAPDGALTQKPGPAACVSDDGTGGSCADGVALGGAIAVTVSPDGATAYVASPSSSAVAIFDRAPDGTLTQRAGTAGCIGEFGAPCADGVGLGQAIAVTVSPDGTSVYLSSYSNTVAVFDRELLPAPPPPPQPPPPAPSAPIRSATAGKPHLKLVGVAGPRSARFRIGCGGDADCTIELTGIRELNRKTGRPNGKTESQRAPDRSIELTAGEGKLVGVKYTRYLARTIKRAMSAGNAVAPKLRITAKQAGHGSRTIGVRIGG
jgi:DNA-binding beta-propeller fold protein YncE